MFVFLGVLGLVFKDRYVGQFEQPVHSYAGNITASFAVYFIVANLFSRSRFRRLLTVGLALVVVELFELSDGFGVMSNVYDPFDLVANTVGITLACVADLMTASIGGDHRNRHGE